jgi:hypothetical protein
MMQQKIHRQFVLPLIVPIGVAAVVGLLIFGVGEALLNLYNHNFTSEFKRPELWGAVFVALAIIGVAGFLATFKGSLGPLDRPVAFGGRPMLAPLPTPIEIQARRGPTGTAQDIKPGFILYARNGALAKVIDMLPNAAGDTPYHRHGFIYAEGLYGADKELWIPVEAVAATYPETNTAILAISGDETAAFGWNRAPLSITNRPGPEGNKLY